MRDTSVVCTSFNRPDLLERTLRSFHRWNSHPIEKFIVIDDSGEVGCNNHLKEAYPNIDFQYNQERVGQIRSIDIAYEQIETRYVFHLEEDWEFYNNHFIQDSFEILERNPNVICVWLRANGDTNGHKYQTHIQKANGVKWSQMKLHQKVMWHGFTFNPGLRRMSDYYNHGPYDSIAKFVPLRPWISEAKIGIHFMKYGFVAAIIRGSGYMRHIGKNRTIGE